ncbi:MBL fold metallo-hydrolase [Fulvimarina sp. MAC3]|uniref:MBL fold metallo-hydrolase n=1 Tax=Fulvimarina sp. MAC3 TaxID=3148887 RepID=UPI0031FC06C0
MPETAAIDDFEAVGPCEEGPGAGLTLLALKAGRIGFPNYAYVVADMASGEAIVIDPGWEAAYLCDRLAGMGLAPVAILLTHGHRDHTEAAPAIAREAGCPVYMARADAEHFRFACNGLMALETSRTLRFGSISVDALATPGHTAGSLSYRIGTCLFTGDTLFSEGCGLANPPNGGGDAGALFQSLQHLRETLSPGCRVYPGHRYRAAIGQTFSTLETSNIYLRFRELGAFAAFCARPARARNAPPSIGSVPLMAPELVRLTGPGRLRETPPDLHHAPEVDHPALRRAS